jgi:hypothetical protein
MIFTRGFLARVQTIHFAHWFFFDDKDPCRLRSNYDGSHQGYMDDFINKVGWGLNILFSNGVGWPATRWLIFGGSRIEQSFKYYQRRHQVPTQVWYKAYPGLALVEMKRNHRIRQGPGAADDERFRSPCLAEAAMNTTRSVELDDIQGLVRFGYKHHTEAAFLLLRVKDREAARRWLASVPVSTAATAEPPSEVAVQVALTAPGMRALGVGDRDRRELRRRVRVRPGRRRQPHAPPRRRRREPSEPMAVGRRRACASRRGAALCPTGPSPRSCNDRSKRSARKALNVWRASRRPISTAPSRSASWTASRSRCLTGNASARRATASEPTIRT